MKPKLILRRVLRDPPLKTVAEAAQARDGRVSFSSLELGATFVFSPTGRVYEKVSHIIGAGANARLIEAFQGGYYPIRCQQTELVYKAK